MNVVVVMGYAFEFGDAVKSILRSPALILAVCAAVGVPLDHELCLSSLSSPLVANKPSGRHIAREPLEDALWPSRALLAASASRCSSWRSAVSARGSR